jgi:hypothetical protein
MKSAKNSTHIPKLAMRRTILCSFWDNNYGDNKASESHIWSIFLWVFCTCSFSSSKAFYSWKRTEKKLMNNVKQHRTIVRWCYLFHHTLVPLLSAVTFKGFQIYSFSLATKKRMYKFSKFEPWKRYVRRAAKAIMYSL